MIGARLRMMSEPSGSREECNDDKFRKCSFKLIPRKKKITKKSSRISFGECTDIMGKTWDKDVPFKDRKTRGSKRERWLLTRKTWRYMADAGRKLIPEGVGNRPEDVPKIEAYFQEVCQKEPRFLLWRKQSYPGALGFRSRGRPRGNQNKLGSVRENAGSADEAENIVKVPSVSFLAHTRQAGRYELEQLRKEFLFGSSENNALLSNKNNNNNNNRYNADSKSDLVQFINSYINNPIDETMTTTTTMPMTTMTPVGESSLDHERLLKKLEDYISKTKDVLNDGGDLRTSVTTLSKKSSRTNILESDNTQKNLLETLRRYYARSTNREKVIGDLLMDRKLLENLYFELRKTKGFLGRRTVSGSLPLSSSSSSAAGVTVAYGGLNALSSSSSTWKDAPSSTLNRKLLYDFGGGGGGSTASSLDYLQNGSAFNGINSKAYHYDKPLTSPPPPVIEIEDVRDYDDEDDFDDRYRCKCTDVAVQTEPLEPTLLSLVEDENGCGRTRLEMTAADYAATTAVLLSDPLPASVATTRAKALQRKPSSENDVDVSPSVSDTIKRYLRMARKKSVESDKTDRFKRVNYDRNIRNIRGKGEPDVCEGDDTNRSVQTDDSWLSVLKTVEADCASNSRITSSRSSIDTGTTFSGEEYSLLSPPLSPPKSLNGNGKKNNYVYLIC